jgi:aminoglycoside phosphotransferase (APT) family kinase protein
MADPHPDGRAAALERWLAPRIGVPAVTVTGLSRTGSGNSNETVLFTASWQEAGAGRAERFVVRVQPGQDSLFLRPDVAREAAVLSAVGAEGGVPVPGVLGVESDPSVLGSPFFVMTAVDGRVLIDMPTYHRKGWLKDLPAAARARHWDEGLKALAAIARLPAEPFAFLADASSAGTPLQQLLTATREYFDWAVQGRDVGVLGAAMEHLERSCPDVPEGGLSWGDSRPGNVLYGEDGTVAAVLDWEMAAFAPAELDLAWWVMMEEFYSTRSGVPPLDGVPDEAAVLARWEQLVGRPSRDLHWFKVLAGVRMGLVMLRSRDANVEKGVLPPGATTHTHNPMTQMLAGWLGLPEPELSPHFLLLLKTFKQEKALRASSSEETL